MPFCVLFNETLSLVIQYVFVLIKSPFTAYSCYGIQIVSEVTVESRGNNHSCSPKMLTGSKERKQHLVVYIYISHSSCSSADGYSTPGGNCIYISHSSCSSADGYSRPGGNYIYISHSSCSSADGYSRPGGNYIYISHSSCSSADGYSTPGGNCIYISHSSCSSADGYSTPGGNCIYVCKPFFM